MKDFKNFEYKRLVIVAYRLPFKLVRKKEEYFPVQNSGGLVSAILSLSERMNFGKNEFTKILWVGTGEKLLGEKNIHSKFELFPVEIPHKVNEKYYGGFCNNTIWPLFHYVPSRTVYDHSYFDAYVAANTLFFEKLKNLIRPGDFIWVHDYQLFMLPNMIRNSFSEADIGFFLHIPFPSFEIFRLLPRNWRETILTGMTGADIVGFHTNDYTQHFIKSVKRTLGSHVNKNLITVQNRLCKADAFPIGIDFDKFHEACHDSKTLNYKKKLKNILEDRKLIFSVDRLDFSKGFTYKLKAYEHFLEKYPEWHFKVVFNMIVVPSRENIENYRQLKSDIDATVGRINGKYSTFSWRPIIYQYKSVPFNELVAIYDISDVGLITPLRDGMNLVAKEYVACQRERLGMLVLSEMAGAAVELSEAIIINPTDVEETADAINRALTMDPEEKLKRINKMQQRLSRYTVFTWTIDFFNQVYEIRAEQKLMKVKFLDEKNIKSIHSEYIKSENRLFLFDYDGTLTPIVNLPEMAIISSQTKELLEKISKDSRNKVAIVSGRKPEFMDEQFKDMDLILVAEHGYFSKYPGKEWKVSAEINLSWKDKILPLMNEYVDRCNGSMLEEKHSSLVWHYRNAEEEVASLRINELKDNLFEILKTETKLVILEGDKVLEIKSVLYDKGTIVATLMKKKCYDFILAIGDDSTDEDLFRALPESGISIKVGNEPTNARFSIENQNRIYEVLMLLTEEHST